MTEPLAMRFADILTTATSVATYLGAAEITAAHMLDAIAVLSGTMTTADLGRQVSPLLARHVDPQASPPVRDLVRQWFAFLGSDPEAGLDAGTLARLIADLKVLVASTGGGR